MERFAENNSCLKKCLNYWILAVSSKTARADVEPLGLAFPLSEWISWLKPCSLGFTVFFRLFLAPCHSYSSVVTAQSGNTVKCQRRIFRWASISNTTTAWPVASSLSLDLNELLGQGQQTMTIQGQQNDWSKQSNSLTPTNKRHS